MTSGTWSSRAKAYATSPAHNLGPSLEKLALLAAARPGTRALDIGTGAGHVAALLSRSGATVVALDPSEGMLSAARELYGELSGLTFMCADAGASNLQSETFDLVTARHTLHHHRELTTTLREVRRLLRPGGRFVLVDETTPHPCVDSWFDELERTRDATHVRANTMSQWRSLIAEAGLLWVVGDDNTRYRIEVARWVERAGAGTAQRARIRRHLAEAPAEARELFAIEYDSATGDALVIELPMAVILATKPGGGET